MRMSMLFGRTLRETPSGVEVAGHGLLLRAGFIRQLAAGVFSYLPLAKRSFARVGPDAVDRTPTDASSVLLLPAFDPYVMGSLRQLDRIVAGPNKARVSRPQGWISPTLVVDGRIEGTWERVDGQVSVSRFPAGRGSR